MRRTLAATVVAVASVALVVAPARPAGGGEPVTYRPPADAPVTDPFRPPTTPYGRGNRGLELGTEPGDPVHAAAAGTVTFAGQVGGRRYVTVQHADGVRTTYGPLASLAVARGAAVAAGEPVGTAGGPVLWTARIGTAYVDPAVLLAASGTGTGPGGRPRVRLVAERALGPR